MENTLAPSARRRRTRQRRFVWDALVERRDAHLSAEDVAEIVRSREPTLHRATVYRTLAMFVDEGLLLRTDLGGDRAYYELAGDHPHHHVVCSACGLVTHVHDDALARVRAEIERASGFRVSDSELTFSGRCPRCATA